MGWMSSVHWASVVAMLYFLAISRPVAEILLFYLLVELSGQCIRAPCAVERDAPQEPGSKLGPDASAFHQKIISSNSYEHDEQGDNPGQE